MKWAEKRAGTLWLILILMVSGLAGAQSASDLLQDAIYAEDIEGDLDKALKLYDRVLALESGKRSYKAQALFRKGLCFLKKNDESSAKATLEKLKKEFDDQTRIIEKAKTILADLSIVDPAYLMPPGTLAYVEIGSPGKQVETILSMLKGTPLENPMQALGMMMGGMDHTKSPSDIISALMNPSMMAELKKIRGMASGIVGIRDDGSAIPMVVLYPGESDALRGFLEAAIRVAGKADEAVGEMESLRIGNEAFVALDKKAIFVSKTRDQLVWAAKQYQGLIREPSLAGKQDFFGRVSKKARQDNTLTLWANINEIYEQGVKRMAPDQLPEEVRMADIMLDLKHLDELIGSFSIKPNGIHLDVHLNLEEGHQCLVHNLIHTPQLSKRVLNTIPPDTVLLATIALGEDSGPAAEKLREPIKQLTGLDIGREIFANIEQVQLFAVPPKPAHTQQPPAALLSCVGLSVTSHNPQQTLALFQKLLDTAAKAGLPTQTQGQKTSSGLYQYTIPVDNKQNIPCFVGQQGKTTTLCLLDGELATRVLKRVEQPGPIAALDKPLSQVSPETSKLVALNLGGLITIADALILAMHDNPDNPGHKALQELAKACSGSTFQIQTNEGAQSIKLHVGLNELPGLDHIVGPLGLLSQVDVTAKTKATWPHPKHKASPLPGKLKLAWSPGVLAKTHKLYLGESQDSLKWIGDTQKTNARELEKPEFTGGKTYYWRVDEVWKSGEVITGDTWEFTPCRLMAHYLLNDGEGHRISDHSGNRQTGRIVGSPLWVADNGESLLKFSGSNHVNIPSNVVDFSNGFTLSVWAKPTQAGNWARFLEFGSGTPQDNITFGRWGEGDTLVFEVYHGQEYHTVEVKEVIELNTWQHFVATCDHHGYATIYCNGKRRGGRHLRCPRQTKREYGYIGKACWEENDNFQGYMRDIRIYDTGLSADSIKALYLQGAK